ncbi:MAG: hypothetical protein K8F91_14740, partial [Candidatus Obscuribacterales bacterium]|nr:hypothetical protein [Candidatus Obscuribacterales bacterium]
MKTTGDKRLMEYSDGTSSFALWWKSVFLIPIWGVLPAALLGSLMWRLGFVFVEMGYVLVLLVGMVYFVEDLLKRKIKIQDGKLFLGFRKYFLSKLHSLKVIYDSKRIIPQYLVFSFQDGKQFHLYLARLLASDIQYIVSLIDTRYPHCRVDPVLRHLARCHDLAPVLKEADDGPITISYQSNRIIEEMKDSFLSMFGSWSRLGPSIALLLFAPMWSVFTFGAFSIFKLIPGSEGQSLVAETLQNLFTHLNNVIGEVVGSALTQAGTAATTPVAGCIAAIISIFLIARIIGNLIKPNQLHLDPANLSFQKSVFLWTTTMERIPWAKVVHAQLLKPENDKDLEGWKISLRATENQELKRLDLAALDQHSRRDFLKRLKIYAPQCNLEPDLEEAL